MLKRAKKFLFSNTSARQTVTKNTFWLAVSNFGGRLIKAGIIIYAARVLGTADYGVFSYAVTLAGFLTLFMDPGINSILVRDVSKADSSAQKEFFSTTFFIKIVLLFIGINAILFIAPMLSKLPGARAILPIAGAILALDTLREFFTSFLRAQERMEWDAFVFILTNLGILIFGFVFFAIKISPASLAWAYVAGDVIGIISVSFIIRKNFKNLVAYFNSQRILPILNSAWPFAITGALGALLTSADILIISWMKTASDVGVYSAAIRIIQILYIIPVILQVSTLPLFSRLADQDSVRFRDVLERTIKALLLTGIPLAVGGIILGTPIMQFIFGEAYAVGGNAFKILIAGLIFDFPTVVIVSAIFAYGRQRSLIAASAIGGISNVVFDLLLIPKFGIAGSAVATLATQALSNWYLWHTMKKINYFKVLPSLGRVVVSCIIMAIAASVLFINGVNILLNITASASIYMISLYVLREPLIDEFKNVFLPGRSAT